MVTSVESVTVTTAVAGLRVTLGASAVLTNLVPAPETFGSAIGFPVCQAGQGLPVVRPGDEVTLAVGTDCDTAMAALLADYVASPQTAWDTGTENVRISDTNGTWICSPYWDGTRWQFIV